MRSKHFHPPRRRCKRGHCTHKWARGRYRKHQIEMVRVEGQGGVRTMLAQEKARQLGRSRGGRQKARNGRTEGNFTSETARKAALKLWATRWRKIKRIGTRVGYPALRRPKVGRQAVREAHLWGARTQEAGIYYVPPVHGDTWYVGYWLEAWVEQGETHTRRISERTALQKLGHLPRPRKHLMPVE